MTVVYDAVRRSCSGCGGQVEAYKGHSSASEITFCESCYDERDGEHAYADVVHRIPLRTVDSELPITGLEPGDSVNLYQDIAPNDLVQKDIHLLPTPDAMTRHFEDEKFSTCRIEGTFMDGEFVAERAGFNSSCSYHSPPGQEIDKEARYVVFLVRPNGIQLAIEEERFEQLIEEGVLHETN